MDSVTPKKTGSEQTLITMIRTATDIMMKRRYYHLPTRWIEQTLRWSLDIGLPGGTNHDNDNGQGTSDPVQFEDIPSEYTVVMVAFATTTDQFTPVFNPDPNFPFPGLQLTRHI